MTINVDQEGEKLCLKVKGRLDTTTAPQLEEMLKEKTAEIRDLIFDFGELEYISSAGLRTLLAAQKSMKKQQGSMIIRGVNEEVMEVFLITGFSDILTVIKA